MATLIWVDGTETEVQPKYKDYGFTCAELYELIDCRTVEVVNLADGRIMVIDEDGKSRERAFVNPKATRLLRAAGGIPGDVIVGSAVICTTEEFK